MCKRTARYISKAIRVILVGIIRLYQYCISPLLGARCRFHPGCSTYACEAIEQYGAVKGCWLTFKRLIKCHPLHPGGYDPVLDKDKR